MKSRIHTQTALESISIVVPLYNEEESIAQLHDRLLPVVNELEAEARVQLVLVDDGSTDSTYSLLQRYFGPEWAGHCQIVQHPANRGIAAAMRTGFKAATGQIVCTMDSDCSYAPEQMIGMIRLLREKRADIVTASPYHPAALSDELSHRLFLSRACSILYRLLVPEKLYCYTSFFRVHRREWARPDMFAAEGFLGVTEYMVTAAYCGASIVEYPARLGTRKFGRSKMRTLRVIREHLGLLGQTLWLNARLRLDAGRRGERPIYALGEELEPLLGRLDYLGQFRLIPKPAQGLRGRLEINPQARTV